MNQVMLFQEGLPEVPLKAKVDLKVASRPWSKYCQIDAPHDIAAVFKWLQEYKSQKNTYMAYKREALRFLLWCTYEQGKALAELRKEEIESYFLFLQRPPKHWCVTQDEKETWKPFRGHLSESAFLTAVRILSSLFNYLVQAEYLRANPIKLIKKYSKLSLPKAEQKYKVWERILEQDEWQVVQETLMNMSERNQEEQDNKWRTQFLFALLYFLGLRIHEVVNHTWGSIQSRNNQWWFFVKGKGGKFGHVPINEQLLEIIKAYRQHLNKPPLPQKGELELLLVSKRTKRGLKITQAYSLVKAIGEKASLQFKDKAEKQRKLQALSPHWLRHLAASHQDRLGIPLLMIQENLRHQSSQTTQLYVHQEDEERFKQMQKMQMEIKLKTAAVKKPVGVEYRLTLEKGPLDKVIGLERLLGNIEQLFKNFKGQWRENKKDILEKVKKEGIALSQIKFAYQVYAKEVIDQSIWEEALQRQCESWLFKAEIERVEINTYG